MAAITAGSPPTAEAPEWARKYPPLIALVVAGLIALAVLPSSLTLPQTNPTETLEYAPVPPDEDAPPPDNSNLSSLGLGSSSNIEGEGAGGEGEGGGESALAPPPTEPGGTGQNPTTKRCVGNPPRQTEDPIAPPCVPFFTGDNGGATYQGVTGEEIRILMYIDGGINYTNGSNPGTGNVAPENEYFDLFEPPKEDEEEHLIVRGFRGWQRYFNERFQTYNRRVHFYVFLADNASGGTPEARRADAADNYKVVKPFAVISFATEGNEDAYLQQMARKGVLNFGSLALKPGSFYNQFPKLIWSYDPSIEQQADQYMSYICSKVVNQDSVLAGPNLNNQPRKLGIIYTTDKKQEGLRLMADIVKQRLGECGGKIEAEATFPECCIAQDNGDTGTYGQEQMADFVSKGITTILWPGGINGNFAKNAAALNYYPEWVLLGDGLLDANGPVKLYAQMSPSFDGHAVVVTPQTFQPANEQQRCWQAYKEADPDLPDTDLGYICEYYRNIFQVFIGIQVAGPRLGPTSIDKGFHAIPAVESTDVQTPACFYLLGDYTCVKDAIVEIWRAGQTPPGAQQPGCWAAIEDAKRYLPNKWPPGNINAQITGAEPCNAYSSSVRVNLA